MEQSHGREFDDWFNSAIVSSFASQGPLFEQGNRSRPQLISQLISRLVWSGFPTPTAANVGEMHRGASHPVIQPLEANTTSDDPITSRPTVPLSDNIGSSLSRQATTSLPDILDVLDSNVLESRPTLRLPSSFHHQRHSYYAELPESPLSTSVAELGTTEPQPSDAPPLAASSVRVLPEDDCFTVSQHLLAPRPSTPVTSHTACAPLPLSRLRPRRSAPTYHHSCSRLSQQQATNILQHRLAVPIPATDNNTSALLAHRPSRLPSISSVSEAGTEAPILTHITRQTQPHALFPSFLGSRRVVHASNDNSEQPWLNPETEPLLGNSLEGSSSDGVVTESIPDINNAEEQEYMEPVVIPTRQLLVDQAVQTSCGPHGGWANMIDQVSWRYTPSTTNQTALLEDVTTNSSNSVTGTSSDSESGNTTYHALPGNPIGEFGDYQRIWDRITTVHGVDMAQSARTSVDIHDHSRTGGATAMQDTSFDLLDEQIRLLEGAFEQETRQDEPLADTTANLPSVTVYGYGSLLRPNPPSPNPHVFAQARQIGHLHLITDHSASAAAAGNSNDTRHVAQTGNFTDQATNTSRTITTVRGTTHHVAAGTSIPITTSGPIRQYWHLMSDSDPELADTNDATQPLLPTDDQPQDDPTTETAESATDSQELLTAMDTVSMSPRPMSRLVSLLQRGAQRAGINVGARQPSWAGVSGGSRLQRSAGYQEQQSMQARVRQLLSTRHWTSNDPPDGNPLHGLEIPAWAARFSPNVTKPAPISCSDQSEHLSSTPSAGSVPPEALARHQTQFNTPNRQQGYGQVNSVVTETISFSPGTSVSTTSWPAPLSFASPFLGWRSAALQMSETVVHGSGYGSDIDLQETAGTVDELAGRHVHEDAMAVTDSNADSSVLMASIGSQVPSPTSTSNSSSIQDLRVVCSLQIPSLFPSMNGIVNRTDTCADSSDECTSPCHNQGCTSAAGMDSSATAIYTSATAWDRSVTDMSTSAIDWGRLPTATDSTMTATSNMDQEYRVNNEIETEIEPNPVQPLPTLFLPRAQSVTHTPEDDRTFFNLPFNPNRPVSHSQPTSPMHRLRGWLMSGELWRRSFLQRGTYPDENQNDVGFSRLGSGVSANTSRFAQPASHTTVAEQNSNGMGSSGFQHFGRLRTEDRFHGHMPETAGMSTELTSNYSPPDEIPLPTLDLQDDDVEAVIHLPDLSFSAVNTAPMARRNAVFYRDGLPPEIALELGLTTSSTHPTATGDINDSTEAVQRSAGSLVMSTQVQSVASEVPPDSVARFVQGRFPTTVQTALPAALQPLSVAVPVTENSTVEELGVPAAAERSGNAIVIAGAETGLMTHATLTDRVLEDASTVIDFEDYRPLTESEETVSESLWGPTGSEASTDDADVIQHQVVPQMSTSAVKALMSPECMDTLHTWTEPANVDMINGCAAHMLQWLCKQAAVQHSSLSL